eukprot:144301-Chlamydomonas_euryale.AAC.3
MVRDDVVADLDDLRPALLERLLQQQRLQRSIEHLAHVLQQHRTAESHAVLQRPQHVLLRELDHVEALFALHVLDPLVGLHLRVNHERPAPRLGHDDAVLDRDCVGRQPRDRPRADAHRVLQRADKAGARAAGHAGALQLLHPLGRQLRPVRRSERPRVRDRARCDNNVADRVDHVDAHLVDGRLPPDFLPAEAADELVGALQLDSAVSDLLRERLLLVGRLLELRLEHVDLLLHHLELGLRLGQARHRGCQLVLRALERRALGRHLERDVMVHVHGAHPHADRRARLRHLGHRVGRELLQLDERLDLLD